MSHSYLSNLYILCYQLQVFYLFSYYYYILTLKKNFILIIYFWLRWVFVAARGLSLITASRGYSSLRCTGFSLWWLLLLRNMSSRCTGFSSCGTWAQQWWLTGSRARAQQLWRTGLVAAQHVGPSRTRAQTRVPCIGRQILNHCTTREAPGLLFFKDINITDTIQTPCVTPYRFSFSFFFFSPLPFIFSSLLSP